MSSFWQIEIMRPGDLSPRAFDFFSDLSFPDQLGSAATRDGHPDYGDWRFTWLLPAEPDRAEILAAITLQSEINAIGSQADLKAGDIIFKSIAEVNWLVKSYRGFPPFRVGRFYLYGHHHEQDPIPEQTIPIIIDAVTAFGSGEHPTTKGCLLWLEKLFDSGAHPTRVLDMGTGSGILAIAAWKLWGDIDREAVRVACEYRAYNRVPSGAKGMMCKQAASPDVAGIAVRGPYDLIIANILAAPLRTLAPAMAGVTTKNGRMILSGILDNQREEVVAAYTPHGFKLIDQIQIDDWVALHLHRKG
jgi:ribosomal protein L11 methyltransferase